MTVGKPKPYIDDIFHRKGNTFEEHLAILGEISQCLLDAGMQVNLEKSTLCSKSVEFLGFSVGQKGFQPKKKRIEAIVKLDFLVLSVFQEPHFFKNHIPNCASIMEPITRLTKKETPFVWGQKQKESFNTTLEAEANSILCVYSDPNRPFIIYPDASQK